MKRHVFDFKSDLVLPNYVFSYILARGNLYRAASRTSCFVISDACTLKYRACTRVSTYSQGEFILHRDSVNRRFLSLLSCSLSLSRSVYELILLDFYDITYPHLARAPSL